MQVSVEVRVTSHNGELFVEEISNRVVGVAETALQGQLARLSLKGSFREITVIMREHNAKIGGDCAQGRAEQWHLLDGDAVVADEYAR